MLSKTSSFASVALTFFSFLGVAAADSEGPQCYTTRSIQGSWALIATYGANVAVAYGRRQVDPNGKFTGTFLLNGPTAGSTTGQRTITTGTQVGYYTVNCDGTGTVTRILTASNGTTVTQIDDFVITKAVVKGGQYVATAIADAVRTPSALVPGGIFVDRVMTRLPDGQGPTE